MTIFIVSIPTISSEPIRVVADVLAANFKKYTWGIWNSLLTPFSWLQIGQCKLARFASASFEAKFSYMERTLYSTTSTTLFWTNVQLVSSALIYLQFAMWYYQNTIFR